MLPTLGALSLLAFWQFLIPLFGVGTKPALAALCLYSLLPVVLNTFTGIRGIDPRHLENARAFGLTPGQILLRIASFFRHETCGQCVPCRVGVLRQQETLQRLVSGKPLGSAAQEIAMLREIAQAMRDASICGLGQTASSALESAMRRWSLFA